MTRRLKTEDVSGELTNMCLIPIAFRNVFFFHESGIFVKYDLQRFKL